MNSGFDGFDAFYEDLFHPDKGDEWKGQTDEPPPRPQFHSNLNRIKMSPQPRADLVVARVVSNYAGVWGEFEMGKGMSKPFGNQPACVVGIQKDKDGTWYWLLND